MSKKDDDEEECDYCNGKGEVNVKITEDDGSTFYKTKTCSECNGTGKAW